MSAVIQMTASPFTSSEAIKNPFSQTSLRDAKQTPETDREFLARLDFQSTMRKARTGDINALFKLGLLFEQGTGVTYSAEKAERCFAVFEKNGYSVKPMKDSVKYD